MFLTMLQASVADMIGPQLATIAVLNNVKTALSKPLTTDQGTYSETEVMAKLRRIMEELFRLRKVHEHSYEHAQLAVLARLRTWSSAGWKTAYDMATLFSDRPEPALAKALEAFQGAANPITALQSSLKQLEEYKKTAAPVIATMKAGQAKGLASSAELKALSDKIGKLVEQNKKLERMIEKKQDKGRGRGGDRNNDDKKRKKKPNPAGAATAAAAAGDEVEDGD
jgi:hypothetical protein